ALLVTVFTCGILTLLMASYLAMVNQQHLSVTRAQAWEQAIAMAEAGVEEAMAHLNDTNTITGLRWTLNKWKYDSTGHFFYKTNALTNGYYFVKFLTNTPTRPLIIATGYVTGPISSPVLSRAVQVKTIPISKQIRSEERRVGK